MVQLALLLGDRSWYASATDHAGGGGGRFRRASTGAVLDKAADLPVASMTGAWGRQCRKVCAAVAVLTSGSMSLLCRSSCEVR